MLPCPFCGCGRTATQKYIEPDGFAIFHTCAYGGAGEKASISILASSKDRAEQLWNMRVGQSEASDDAPLMAGSHC